ncbi:MAG: hypothetical protein JXJ04_04460 [Spirochaetales bacterium]|nr:hypothetical protein [Spirochaetales bacterium]
MNTWKHSLFYFFIFCHLSLAAGENVSIQNLIRGQDGEPYQVVEAILSHDDTYVVLGATRGKWLSGSIIYCIDTLSGSVMEFSDNYHVLESLAISNDSAFIVSAGARGKDPIFEGEINVWSMNGELKKIIDPETSAGSTFITSIEISPDNRTFLSGGNVKTAKLMNQDGIIIRTFNSYTRYEDPQFSEYSVQISADMNYILLQTDYHTTLWKFDGPLHDTLPENNGRILFPGFAPTDDSIVYFISPSDSRGTISLEFQNHITGEKGNRFEVLNGDELPLSPPAFTPDKKTWGMVTTKGIKLFNTIDGLLLMTIDMNMEESPAGKIPCPVFSKNGDYFIFCHPDKEKAEILHIPSRKRLFLTLSHEGILVVYDEENSYDTPGTKEPVFTGESAKARYSPGLLSQFFKRDIQ